MLLSIVTGLVVSLGTVWGLVRHWWVLTKFVISLVIVAVAGAFENVWVRDLAERTAHSPAAAFDGTGLNLAVCMLAFTALLWTATVLSVAKPFGRTPWATTAVKRQHQRRRSRTRPGQP